MENKIMCTGEMMFQAKLELIKVANCVRQTNPKDLRKEGYIWYLAGIFEQITGIDPIKGFTLFDIDEYESWTNETLFQDEIKKTICKLAERLMTENIADLRNDFDFWYLFGYIEKLFYVEK